MSYLRRRRVFMLMFKDCPNPDCDSCRNCYNYRYCKAQYEARMPKKHKKYKINYKRLFTVITCFILCIASIPVVWNVIVNMSRDLNDDFNSMYYVQETESEERIVVSDYGEVVGSDKISNPLASPTDQPEQSDTDTQVTEPVELDMSISAYEPKGHYVYDVTLEEKLLMAKVVYVESRGEPYEGQVAVAAVILNRREVGGYFGSSITSVINTRNQFANYSWVTEEMLAECPTCMNAVEDAVKGWDPTRVAFEDGALFFYAYKAELSPEARAQREGVEKHYIGDHAFHVELNN